MRRTLLPVSACGALVTTLLGAAAGSPLSLPLAAQTPEGPYQTVPVSYRNPVDSTYLTALLTLPEGEGPHGGVVLMSIAGTASLVDRLARLGYAVLIPGRRGFVEVEPLLQATYDDLACDAQAAVEYLRGRSDVDPRALGIIAQADDAPPP